MKPVQSNYSPRVSISSLYFLLVIITVIIITTSDPCNRLKWMYEKQAAKQIREDL